jgi:diketogulonate reductase-like aldo/keto reductase
LGDRPSGEPGRLHGSRHACYVAHTQIELHPYVFHAPNVQRLLTLQHKHKILTQAYAPLSPIVRDQGGPVDQIVEWIAESHDASPSQVLLAWAAGYTRGIVVT